MLSPCQTSHGTDDTRRHQLFEVKLYVALSLLPVANVENRSGGLCSHRSVGSFSFGFGFLQEAADVADCRSSHRVLVVAHTIASRR